MRREIFQVKTFIKNANPLVKTFFKITNSLLQKKCLYADGIQTFQNNTIAQYVATKPMKLFSLLTEKDLIGRVSLRVVARSTFTNANLNFASIHFPDV